MKTILRQAKYNKLDLMRQSLKEERKIINKQYLLFNIMFLAIWLPFIFDKIFKN